MSACIVCPVCGRRRRERSRAVRTVSAPETHALSIFVVKPLGDAAPASIDGFGHPALIPAGARICAHHDDNAERQLQRLRQPLTGDFVAAEARSRAIAMFERAIAVAKPLAEPAR